MGDSLHDARSRHLLGRDLELRGQQATQKAVADEIGFQGARITDDGPRIYVLGAHAGRPAISVGEVK